MFIMFRVPYLCYLDAFKFACISVHNLKEKALIDQRFVFSEKAKKGACMFVLGFLLIK